MRSVRLSGLCLALLLWLGVGSGYALVQRVARQEIAGGGAGETGAGSLVPMPSTWFVELASVPLAEAGSVSESKHLAKLRQEKQNFRVAAGRAGIGFRERYAYEVLWNGLSVEIDPSSLPALSRTEGVSALFPVASVRLPDPPLAFDPGGISPDLFTAVAMTGADRVQFEGTTGAGVRVAVIDSGIDYLHPDLGRGFGPGFRVDGGFDFVGDFFTGAGSLPNPDPDPRDCHGHGTHVAGIIGADGGVTGVAPGVTFRAYKVFGCAGGTTTDVILAAMERAVADGNQVVNLSLGSTFQWAQYPTARAGDNLVNRGIVVVASAGNTGESGLYSMGAPGVGRKVIGVASVDNEKVHANALQLPGGPLIGYLPAGDTPRPRLSGSELIHDVGRGCNADRAGLVGVFGKAALIRRGGCRTREKVLNVRNAGATAALIYNNSPGIFLDSAGVPPILLPAATLSGEDGLHLAARARFPTTIVWTDRFTEVPYEHAGLTSTFSSYGNSPELDLKPDLAAPGGLIFSTLPLARGLYGLLSGTSMSSPHVAGAVALLLQAHPSTPAQAVRDILENSAVPRLRPGTPPAGALEVTHHQGAGLVDIYAAVHAAARVFPGKLSLGETEGRTLTRTLSIENDGRGGLTYALSHQAALATARGTFRVEFGPGSAGVDFSSPEVFVPAGGEATVEVTFTEPELLSEGSLFGGFIVLTPRGGGREIRVPYAGLKGDYQSLVAIDPSATSFGNPILTPSPEFGHIGPVAIRPAAGEAAFVLFRLDHPVRRLRMELFDAPTGRRHGRLLEFAYFPRNSAPGEFYFVAWKGRDSDEAPVPGGDYVLRLSVQKALGQDDNPAHWEIWTSAPVTVIR